MALLKFLVITILAAFCYLTIIDSAAISEEVTEKTDQVAIDINPEELQIDRVTENNTNKLDQHICDKQPCGWAIYVPLTRRVNSFITNTCKCSDRSYKCIRTDDDLSVGAYVYHCRQNTTEENIEAPEED